MNRPHDGTPVTALDAEACRLGECPIWCERTNRLWWVDVLAPSLWCYDHSSGRCTRRDVGSRRLGSVALREDSSLLLACDDGLFAYDPETQAKRFLVDPEPNKPTHRKNDGRADSAGNFWIGTLRETDYAPVGCLYRVTPELKVVTEMTGLAIPNSLAFDPERGRMYLSDTRAYEIWVCDYDTGTASRSQPRAFARTLSPARPDGACIDAEGHLWCAEYAGGRIVRYAPSGAISGTFLLPVSHPTSCCFGGPKLERLFVTSARDPLTPKQQEDQPLAGGLLSFEVDVRGRPEFRIP